MGSGMWVHHTPAFPSMIGGIGSSMIWSSLPRKRFLTDLLDTFHKLFRDLKYRYMHNLFSGVLLHTLNNLWVGSGLFLMDVVVHGRRRRGHSKEQECPHFPQSAPGYEGPARAEFVQRCAVVHLLVR